MKYCGGDTCKGLSSSLFRHTKVRMELYFKKIGKDRGIISDEKYTN